MAVTVNGTGCSLIDYLYTDIDFKGTTFSQYQSQRPGDGGLSPGRLVFADEFEKFAGIDFQKAAENIAGGRPPDFTNLGGPAIVALINAAQLLEKKDIAVRFFGGLGNDESGKRILDIVKRTPVNIDHYISTSGASPSTIVFSDPNYDNGNGERSFINNIGPAWNYGPENLDKEFFAADIVLFGATGLVPRLHDSLTDLLSRAKENECITLVTTAFDFRNEKKSPDTRWPLGESDKSYEMTDLLITDLEEALRLSGTESAEDALSFFRDKGAGACIVTGGSNDIALYSEGKLFTKTDILYLPVSERIGKELKAGRFRKGDTTGCGDNFAGGVLASTAEQLLLSAGRNNHDLIEAVSWGVVSGGFALSHIGGTYIESAEAEKRSILEEYYKEYRQQISEVIK